MAVAFVASGDVSDYDQSVQDAIALAFATETGVERRAVTLSATLSDEPASVLISATLKVPEGNGEQVVHALSAGLLASASAREDPLLNGMEWPSRWCESRTKGRWTCARSWRFH